MEYNLLKIGFGLMAAVIIVVGGLINCAERHLPTFFLQSFRFGKHAFKGVTKSRIKPITLPKRWFSHFYLFAAAYTAFIMVVTTNIYFYEGTLRPWMVLALDFLASSSRRANVTAVSTYVALSLMTLQAWHRFYETWFISVFSSGRIDLTHYIVGYVHYFGAVTAILAEAPGFLGDAAGHQVSFSLADLRLLDIIGATLFVASCYLQFNSAVTLANLRKNSKGHVVTHKHLIPKGGWFELISSPHLFAEILMYFSITLVLWGSHIWPYVFVWVLCNQVENALLTHWWYKETFKHYPRARKAIFPYVL